MAYAMLARVPPVFGLYTALLPQLGYLTLGTCRHLSVGPFALISMLTAQGVMEVVPDPAADPEAAVAAASVIALLSGGVLLAMGVLRLGFVAALMSDSVLSGYTTAVSLIIPLSQMKFAFQVHVQTGRSFFREAHSLLGHILKDGVNYYALSFFFAAAIAIYLLQVLNRHPRLKACPIPCELVVVVVSIVVCQGFDMYADSSAGGAGVAVVGAIPSGLPPMALPSLRRFDLQVLLSPVLMVALMTYVTSMSCARTFGRQFDYDVDSNQELIALGASNLLSSVSSGFPASASFSRTAVAASAGATTPLYGLWTSAVVLAVLAVLSPLLEALPKAVLAAIVAMAFKNLLLGGINELRMTWRVSFSDCVMWNVAFWSTLLTDVTMGIAIAVAANFFYLVWCTTRPTFAVLGRLEGTERFYSDRRAFARARSVDGVLIFRFDAPLNFANREVFLSRLRRELRAADVEQAASGAADAAEGGAAGERRHQVRAVIVDLSPMSHIDVTACRTLAKLRLELSHRCTRLVLAQCEYRCYQKLSDMGFFDPESESGGLEAWCFRELHDAVRFGEKRLARPDLTDAELGLRSASAPVPASASCACEPEICSI
eukprot:TRINITY_DN46952_c0_g1_i1.p1 TRINITY_DN46952_c0_g1~~TRINITY_DN46952_c0_g1_i1.p1  ORF type:complete len:634 (+),score=147.81 TRINITY_DN46952_c0_g1_i1:102-1904(+)